MSGLPYFDLSALKYALEHTLGDPIRTEQVADGVLRIYKDPDSSAQYLVGINPSEGRRAR